VSEDGGFLPAPVILDASVLTEAVRGDAGVLDLILGYDVAGQPLLMPALAVVAASLDMRSDDAAATLRGLEQLENVSVAPVQGADQAVRLAAVISRTGLDPWDAHVAMVADAEVCSILTLDGRKWREHESDLDDRLHYVEISDPDDS